MSKEAFGPGAHFVVSGLEGQSLPEAKALYLLDVSWMWQNRFILCISQNQKNLRK